ncbi:class I SAM-dependent methyltransferase [Poritiphilus flavus]|uniref:Methyltransferase domain-containing protein n=1 Tax=Poritiphilus flavus TaxID=2697053 RepID=A0A6L9E967_9FLAO|nr:class I SAM-dependent methyltransferase [Poritiphilus flavus]NAS11152.1 methyltransferase domain-containing protein [Poritiphilus flavus]
MHYKYKNRKTALFSDLPERLLEIGPGAGANMRYYKPGTEVIAVEPNPHMHRSLIDQSERYGLQLRIVKGSAEVLNLMDNSIDAVVSTLTLCTIPDERQALSEIKRVLKPGGKFYFLEHVAANKGSLLRRIQIVIHRPWKWFFDGCHTHKNLRRRICETGFSNVQIENFKLYSPFIPITPQISGIARK